MQSDRDRRFGGVARLYGASALERLAGAHVVVVGVGGVGSWAVEALARSGVGRLTLVDADHVAVSNVNRQVHALESTLGAAKVDVMRARVREISPECRVDAVDEMLGVANAASCVPAEADVVVDAIDSPRAKAALVAACVARGQAILVCGAAGARRDPLRLARVDLALATGDALLAAVRHRLRRDHGFARGAGRRFGVTAIVSTEAPAGSRPGDDGAAGSALACAGYGSVVAVTATMGMVAAAAALDALLAIPIGERSGPAASGTATTPSGEACGRA